MARKRRRIDRRSFAAEGTHCLLETTGGSRLVPRTGMHWGEVGDQLAPHLAEHFKLGNAVLMDQPEVRVSLNEIKQAALARNPTYRNAFYLLHVHRPGEEQPITKLQHYLLSAFRLSLQDVRDPKKRRAAVDAIVARLGGKLARKLPGDAEGRLRTEGAIEQWLSGEVTLPRGVLVLWLLRKFNRRLFDELFAIPKNLASEPSEKSRKYPVLWAHNFISTAHRQLSEWMANTPSAPSSPDERFVIRPEDVRAEETVAAVRSDRQARDELKRLVFNDFIRYLYRPLPNDYGIVFVKSLRILSNKDREGLRSQVGKASEVAKKHPVKEGLVGVNDVDPQKEFKIGKTTYGKVYREAVLLLTVFSSALNHVPVPFDTGPSTNAGWSLQHAISDLGKIESVPAGTSIIMPTNTGIVVKGVREDVVATVRDVLGKLHSGELDRYHALSAGALLKVYERGWKLLSAIPVLEQTREYGSVVGNLATNLSETEAQLRQSGAAQKLQPIFGRRKVQDATAYAFKAVYADTIKRIGGLEKVLAPYEIRPAITIPLLINESTERTRLFAKAFRERLERHGIKPIEDSPPTQKELIKILYKCGLEAADVGILLQHFTHRVLIERG